MKEILSLFITFFKISLFSFGGGYAMLPLLKKEVVDKKNWITEEQLLNYYAIGQCTPGFIAVNAATFIGYKVKKYVGSIVCTIALMLPSIIIITIIASVLDNYNDNIYVQKAFIGIRISVATLVLNTVIRLSKKNIFNIELFIFFLSLFVILLVFKLNPITIILLSVIYASCALLWREKQC